MYHSRSSRLSCSLAKSGSTERDREHVEGQIPGGEPGILPFVGHREDVGVVEVRPVAVAALRALRRAAAAESGRPPASRRRRSGRTASTREARRRPAARRAGFGVCRVPGACSRRTRRPRSGAPRESLERCRKASPGSRSRCREAAGARPAPLPAEVEDDSAPRPWFPLAFRIHRVGLPCDHVLVERVLHVRRAFCGPKSRCALRLVLGEEQLAAALALAADVSASPERLVRRDRDAPLRRAHRRA